MKGPAGAKLITGVLKKWIGFDKCLQKIKIVDAGNGMCTAEFTVEQEHTNHFGVLHGGFSATLVDVISTCALLTLGRIEARTVSIDLNLCYCKAGKIGQEVIVAAKTLKAGKTLAFLEVEIKEKKSGDLLVKGRHTKFIMNQ